MKKLLAQLVLMLFLVASVSAASSPLTQTVNMGTVARTSATWTNGTATNSSVTLAIGNYASVSVTANTTSTITAGAVIFELSDDGGTNYFAGGCTRTNAFTTDQTYALIATTKQSWNCPVAGFTHFHVRLSTPISGTGQAIIAISGSASTSDSDMVVGQSNASALQMTVGNPLPAGTNNMGNVGLIDSAGVNKATVTAAGAVKTDPSGVTSPVTSSNLELSQGSTTSGQKGPLMQGAVTATAPSYTTGQTSPLSLTTTGGLRIDMSTCSGCSLDSSAFSASTSSSSATGGVFNDSIAALSSGQQGAMRLTAQRAGHMNPRDAGGGQLFPSAFSSANAIAAQTASFLHGGMMAWTGSAWNMLTLDGSNYLQVNCKTGCAGASDGTGTGSLAAVNNTVVLAMTGTSGAAVEFASGTLAGTTVVAEISTDGGTTWNAAAFTDPIAGLISTSLSNPTSAQYGIVWPGGGVSDVRVRASVHGSGSVTANMRGTVNNSSVVVYGSDGTNVRPLATTTGGLLKVDLSGTAANGTAIKVDNSAVTQPISAASLPLPSGASTAAKQPALGTAGTPSADVLTVQGAASMTALKTDGSAVTQPVSMATAPALVAGSATIGNVGFDRPTTDPYSEAIINFTATGDTTVVSGTAAQTVRVFRLFLVVDTATSIIFKDAATGLTGAMALQAGGSMTFDLSNAPWFTTSTANGFVINQSGTAQVSGRIYYVKS